MSTMYKHWTELIKPKQLEVEERTLTSTFGRFTAEPFERGFGQTIGNSVRRILLSSLMGASIVAVRIKGVMDFRADHPLHFPRSHLAVQ